MILPQIFIEKCYISLLESKNFNELIELTKTIFYQPVKNKQEVYLKVIEISRNNYYTT